MDSPTTQGLPAELVTQLASIPSPGDIAEKRDHRELHELLGIYFRHKKGVVPRLKSLMGPCSIQLSPANDLSRVFSVVYWPTPQKDLSLLSPPVNEQQLGLLTLAQRVHEQDDLGKTLIDELSRYIAE